MASTYSTNLAIELIATGDQANAWGNTNNTNLGTLIEQAISGYVTQTITDGADTVITIPNGASGTARNMYIEMTGTLTAVRNLIVPSNKKLYFIYNNTVGGYSVTVKVSGQTGVVVPNGKKMVLVSNGTDVVEAINFYGASITGVTASSPLASSGGTAPNISLTGTVAVGNGGTGLTTTPANGQLLIGNGTGYTVAGITAGSGISVTNGAGTITIANSAGGTVTGVTASSPLASSGGTAPDISLTGTVAVGNGGTGLTSYAIGDIIYASGTTTLSALADVVTGNALLSGGVGVAPSWGKVGLSTHVSGTLPVANGGTGQASYTVGDLLYASAATTLSKLADVVTGNALISGGVGVAPSWGKIDLTTHVSGTLPVANGGTDLTSYTVGDLLFASGTTTLSKLADVVTGNALLSGGVGVAPSWGKVGLSTHVSGTLPVANGGTGLASYTVGDLLFASGTTTLSKLADVVTGNALISGGVGVAPSWGKIDLTTHVSGTLPVANGGSGAATFTANNVLLGNGTSAFQVVAPGASGNLLTSNGTTWISSAPPPTAAASMYAYENFGGF